MLRYIGKIKDSTFAARARFDYYYARAHHNGDFQQKALAEVPVLRKSPEHAQAIVWAHATLMQWQGKLEEAIKLYQAANRQPDSTWAIIGCLVSLKRYDQAIKLTRELETIGGNVAASACLRAADIYRASGDKAKEVQQLQRKRLESMEILSYVTEDAFVEEKARIDLNMKKPGEHVLFIENQETLVDSTSEPEEQERVFVANPLKWWYYFTHKSLESI